MNLLSGFCPFICHTRVVSLWLKLLTWVLWWIQFPVLELNYTGFDFTVIFNTVYVLEFEEFSVCNHQVLSEIEFN